MPAYAWSLAQIIVATVAIVFALRWAQRFFIPLLLGIILAFTLNPIVLWLERIKIPRAVGTALVMLALLGGGALATLSLRGQVQGILDQVPDAAGKLSAALRDMGEEPNTMQKVQAAAREIEQATAKATDGAPTAQQKTPARIVVEQPRFKLTDLLWTGSLGMFGLIGDAVMLLFLIFFLLLGGDTFKRKLMHVTGPSLSKKKITVSIVDDIGRSVQNYMLTLLAANVLLALLTWMAFHWIGLDNAGAWAVAAGVMHFIPYVGPALTALGASMAAFMQFGSLPIVLLTAGSSLAIATLVGTVIVTWMSSKVGKMNATAVFIALLFWGWLWGAWGLLFAIPIMGMVKVFAEHVEDLQPLAELLGE
ncbi:MAG TPA: AI-2E family transporter [Nitrospira sp.]|nr:AI-2E family transporter [Nitrospira sp.]